MPHGCANKESMETLTLPNEILLQEVGAQLLEGRDVILMTKGSSMLPFIRGEKDSVRLRRMSSVQIRDVVLAQISPGHYVLHRVLAIEGDRLTLMGDGNLKGTESCSVSDILGTAVAIVRPDGSEHKLPLALWWQALLPLRRYILGIYRRLI